MLSKTSSFIQNIASWDISNFTNVESMFDYVISFNQNIELRYTSKADNMEATFQKATPFNQDLSSRGLSNIGYKPTEFAVYLKLEELNMPIWGKFT